MKKAIAVLFTDSHLSEKTIEINKSVWRQANDLAVELKVDLFHGGDIFTSRKSQTQIVLNTFDDILDDLQSKVHLIPGNHDKTNYESSRSYLDSYRHHPNVRLFHNYGGAPIGDVTIHMLPFFSEGGEYVKRLYEMVNDEHLSWNKKNVLLTHVGVNGVKNNDKSVVINSIKQELFDKWDLIIIGHYHNRSLLGDRMCYIGSSYQGNFGEDSSKGCAILYDDLSLEYIKFDFPEYQVYEIDIDNRTSDQLDELHLECANNGNFVRFKFFGTEEKLKALDKQKYQKDGIDVQLVSENIESEIQRAEEGEFVSFTKSNIIEEFKVFCETEELNHEEGFKYLEKQLR